MPNIKPEIKSVQYLDPWTELPPGTSYAGVHVQVGAGGPIDNFLAACLSLNGKIIFYGSGQSTTSVQILPDTPLSPAMQYLVQVQWLPNNTNPEGADWSNTTGNVASAPVLTTHIDIVTGQVLENNFSLTYRNPVGSSGASGGFAQIFNAEGVAGNNLKLSSNASSISIPYPFDKTTKAPYTVFLQGVQSISANSGSGGISFQAPYSLGPVNAGVPIPVIKPKINSVSYNGATVAATWSELSGLPSDVDITYELLLTCQGLTTAYPASSSGGKASLTAPLTAEYTVSARIIYGVIKGPQAVAVKVIAGVVSNITQTTNPGSSKATLKWDDFNVAPEDSIVSYNLLFSSGSPPAGTSNPPKSYIFQSPLTAGELNEVSIARVVTTKLTEQNSSSPYSPLYRLGTSQPTLISATYDGKDVLLKWQVPYSEVTEYAATLTITPSSGKATTEIHYAPGNTTSLEFQPENAITSNDTLSVVLQATLKGCQGLPSLSKEVDFSPSLFIGTTTPSTFPATTLSAITTAPTSGISLFLPNGNYIPTGNSFPDSGISNPPFVLAANNGSNSTNYPYTLTIDKSAFTISTNEIRITVQTAYISFLKAAEKTGYFTAWGISVLQEAIARYMPQSYTEMLYYSYGMNLASSPHYVDLRPGMVLRVMPSDYMVVPGFDGNKGKNYLNGFTNGAPIDYDIGSYNYASGRLVGFDAFIGQLVASDALHVTTPLTQNLPNVGGIAEVADLYSPEFKNPFYRLFIPTNLLSPTVIEGNTQPEFQFNLVSAENFSNLEAAKNPTTGNINTYFRGRAIIKLCIRVSVNGNEVVVPIGTTLINILERLGHVPPRNGVLLNDLKFERAIGQADPVGGDTCQVGRYYAVRFDYQATSYSSDESALDIPLLHGDCITLGA